MFLVFLKILYITNFNSNDVTVFDKTTRKVIAAVTPGSHPTYVKVTNDGKYALISHESSSGICVLNTETNNIEKRLNEGIGNMYFCNEGKTFFQPQISTPFVFVIDVSNFEIIQRIEVGGRPLQLAFSPDEKFAYVTNFDFNEIDKLDTKTFEVTDRF